MHVSELSLTELVWRLVVWFEVAWICISLQGRRDFRQFFRVVRRFGWLWYGVQFVDVGHLDVDFTLGVFTLGGMVQLVVVRVAVWSMRFWFYLVFLEYCAMGHFILVLDRFPMLVLLWRYQALVFFGILVRAAFIGHCWASMI